MHEAKLANVMQSLKEGVVVCVQFQRNSFEEFNESNALVKTESNHKCFWGDNDGEFVSRHSTNF